MKIINWGIVSHPINWLTLFLMVLLAGIAVSFVAEHYTTISTRTGLAGK